MLEISARRFKWPANPVQPKALIRCISQKQASHDDKSFKLCLYFRKATYLIKKDS
jgi:hypothetical protein